MIYANGNVLEDFQQEGVDFLTSCFGDPHKYLCDDCGLGKTVQIAAALVNVLAPSALIICPGTVGVRETWARTLVNWGYCTEDDIHIVYDGKSIIPVHSKKVVIVSHDLAIKSFVHKQLYSKYWGAVVNDEAHVCKTIGSERSWAIYGKTGLATRGYYKWACSATPMPNGDPCEMYPILASLVPSLIEGMSYEQFGAYFNNMYPESTGYGTQLRLGAPRNVEEFKTRISSFVLRRELRNVFPNIPPIMGKTIYINLGELGVNKHNTPLGTLQRLIGEYKVPQVAQYTREWLASNLGKKLIVFAYHREVIKQLEEELSGYTNVSSIVGGMSKRQRDAIKQQFIDSKYQHVLILQITCGGTALDGLQYACHNIIFAEPDWTPGKKNQAIGRILRYGQSEVTYVVEIIADKTIDETKIGSCYDKQAVIDRVFDHNPYDGVINDMTFTPEQVNEGLALANRFITVLEDIADMMADNPQPGNAAGPSGKKRTRRTQAQIQADAAAQQAAIAGQQIPQQPGAVANAPTGVASIPTAGFAPPAVVQNVPAPVQYQQPPQPQLQQPAFAAQQSNGQQVTWEQVEISASNALHRVRTQMSPLDPNSEGTKNAANALMALVVKNILGRPGQFQEIGSQPQLWLTAIQHFDATNHVAQQQQPVGLGSTAGF